MSGEPRVRVAAVVVQDEQILLVRHQKDGQTYWLLPGGGVDFGERMDVALIREVLEETGLTVRVGQVLFLSESIPPDVHRHNIQVTFSAEVAGGALGLGDDPRLAECRFVSFAELPTLILYPNTKDALMSFLQGNGASAAQYLGNLWE